MKKHSIISILLLTVGVSLLFAGCITPPPGSRHHENRRRRDERHVQPNRDSYVQQGEESTVIDGVFYDK